MRTWGLQDPVAAKVGASEVTAYRCADLELELRFVNCAGQSLVAKDKLAPLMAETSS